MLVGAVDLPRAQHGLRPPADAADGSKDVIVPIALVELGTFENRQVLRILNDDLSFVEHVLAIGGHAVQDQRTGSSHGVNQVGGSIVVPERTRVLETRSCDYDFRFAPWSRNFFRGAYVNSFAWGREVNIKAPIMLSDGWCPDSFAVTIAADHAVAGVHVEAVDDVADDGPMDEVRRLKNGNARHEVKGGSYEIVIQAVANHVGIGIVGEEDGVAVDRLPSQRGRPVTTTPGRRAGFLGTWIVGDSGLGDGGWGLRWRSREGCREIEAKQELWQRSLGENSCFLSHRVAFTCAQFVF